MVVSFPQKSIYPNRAIMRLRLKRLLGAKEHQKIFNETRNTIEDRKQEMYIYFCTKNRYLNNYRGVSRQSLYHYFLRNPKVRRKLQSWTYLLKTCQPECFLLICCGFEFTLNKKKSRKAFKYKKYNFFFIFVYIQLDFSHLVWAIDFLS